MQKIGLICPRASISSPCARPKKRWTFLGLPIAVRPSFTLGGTGGGIAFNMKEFEELVSRGLEYSMIHEVLLEESILGWKEFELEVMREPQRQRRHHRFHENLDPWAIHTAIPSPSRREDPDG